MKKDKIFLYGLTISLFFIIVIKLLFIINDSVEYKKKLEEKTTIYVYGNSAPRGRILDTNGKILVDNVGVKTIFYNKIKGVSIEDEIVIAYKLANILSVDEANENELKNFWLINNDDGKDLITAEEYQLLNERKITNDVLLNYKLERITDEMLNSYTKIDRVAAKIYSLMNDGYIYSKKEILTNVSESEYAKVMEANIMGITGELTWKRKYLYGDTLKNILGTIGNIPKENKEKYLNNGYELTDIVGLSYLEYQYEDYLKGSKAKYLVNNDNTLTLIEEEQKGNDLVLSIDIDIQLKVEEILKDKILLGEKYPNTDYYKDSYALISNPLTGAIIAIAGLRHNDDDSWSDISLNTITKSFTIGSAVKGATISVGYKYNLIEMDKYITDSCVKLYMVPQKCSFKSLGKINDLKALAMSSNYYQYLIAISLTGNKYTPNMKLNATEEHFNIYRNMLSSYGLGVKTNIDLPNEVTGIKGNIISDDLLLNLAIGQYDTYTPVQVLQYINSLATGNRLSLSLMKEIKNNAETIKTNEINVLNKVDLDTIYLAPSRSVCPRR